MEPTLPAPNLEPKQPTTPELSPVPTTESASNISPEGTHERLSAPSAAPVLQPVQLPVAPQQPAQNTTPANTRPTDDTTIPQIADDVDVIEKEWVDKAKKIVSTTKDDPYQQERQVSHLQADYLMKRYNKQVKVPE